MTVDFADVLRRVGKFHAKDNLQDIEFRRRFGEEVRLWFIKYNVSGLRQCRGRLVCGHGLIVDSVA